MDKINACNRITQHVEKDFTSAAQAQSNGGVPNWAISKPLEDLTQSQSLFHDFFQRDDGDTSPDVARDTSHAAEQESCTVWEFVSFEIQQPASESGLSPRNARDGGDEEASFASNARVNEAPYRQERTIPVLATPSHDLQPTHVSSPPGSSFDLNRSTEGLSAQNTTNSEQLNPRERRRKNSIEETTSPSSDREPQRVDKETDEMQEKEFFHPRWKIKRFKEDENAGLGSVFRRVEALQIKPFPLNLDEDLLDFTVSREFISDIYGGNPQQTFPLISKKKRALHGYRDFVFLRITYNPYAPQRAGFPGLLYGSRTSDLPKNSRVFIRIKDGVWLYLRQYEPVRADPLTRQEWTANSGQASHHLLITSYNSQKTMQMKTTWSEHICGKKWGARTQARIALRMSLGREPTTYELDTADDTSGAAVTPVDVRRALDSGEETISVWALKCIGYDETFQREMREKSRTWKPKEKLEKKPTNTKKGKRKRQDAATPYASDAEETVPPQKRRTRAEDGIADTEDIAC